MKTFIYTQKPFITYFDKIRNQTVKIEFDTETAAVTEYKYLSSVNTHQLHLSNGRGYYITSTITLVEEASILLDLLLNRLKIATGNLRIKLRRLINKAKRRLNRRKKDAGLPLRVGCAMWIINNKGSEWF